MVQGLVDFFVGSSARLQTLSHTNLSHAVPWRLKIPSPAQNRMVPHCTGRSSVTAQDLWRAHP